MIIAVDVDYRDGFAVAAAVDFVAVTADVADLEVTVVVRDVADYEPGAFYKRELPCVLQVLDSVTARGVVVDTVVVDGHVWLSPGEPGLGARLHAALVEAGVDVAVIGVAKNPWHDTRAHIAVVRGGAKAVHVSAIGIDVAVAAELVAQLDGVHRLPTLLKRVDRLCRDTVVEVEAEVRPDR